MVWEENVEEQEKQQAYFGGRIFTTLTSFSPDLFSLLAHKLSRFQSLYGFLFPLPYPSESPVLWASRMPFTARMWPGILNEWCAPNRICVWQKAHRVIKVRRAWQNVLPDVIFPIRLLGSLPTSVPVTGLRALKESSTRPQVWGVCPFPLTSSLYSGCL